MTTTIATTEPISLGAYRAEKRFPRLVAAIAADDTEAFVAASIAFGIPPYLRKFDDGRIDFVVCVVCGAALGNPDPDDLAPRCGGCRGEG